MSTGDILLSAQGSVIELERVREILRSHRQLVQGEATISEGDGARKLVVLVVKEYGAGLAARAIKREFPHLGVDVRVVTEREKLLLRSPLRIASWAPTASGA